MTITTRCERKQILELRFYRIVEKKIQTRVAKKLRNRTNGQRTDVVVYRMYSYVSELQRDVRVLLNRVALFLRGQQFQVRTKTAPCLPRFDYVVEITCANRRTVASLEPVDKPTNKYE